MAAKRTIGRSNLKNRRAGTHRAKLKIGRYTTSIRWVPDLHPRGPGGRFIKKG